MSVGLLVVRLKYGLYVGHLSKWFVCVNSFMFLVVCSLLHCRLLGLLVTVCGLAQAGIFTTKLATKPKVQIYEKLLTGELNPRLRQTAVMGRFVCPTVRKSVRRQTNMLLHNNFLIMNFRPVTNSHKINAC